MSQVDPNEKFEEKMKHHEIIDYILLMSQNYLFCEFFTNSKSWAFFCEPWWIYKKVKSYQLHGIPFISDAQEHRPGIMKINSLSAMLGEQRGVINCHHCSTNVTQVSHMFETSKG